MSRENTSLSRAEVAPADGLAVLSPLGHGLKPTGPEQPWVPLTLLMGSLRSFWATTCSSHTWGLLSTKQRPGHHAVGGLQATFFQGILVHSGCAVLASKLNAARSRQLSSGQHRPNTQIQYHSWYRWIWQHLYS